MLFASATLFGHADIAEAASCGCRTGRLDRTFATVGHVWARLDSHRPLGRLRLIRHLGPTCCYSSPSLGDEAVSHPFRFQLELLSEDDAIPFDSLVGKQVSVHVQTVDSGRRLNGYISRFSQGGHDKRFTYYHAEMVPWLWFLTRTADCRIFQGQNSPEIIKKIFHDLNFRDFELRLYRQYRTRDYCVQYRETDLNFVSRLMEEEGIAYFFEHDPQSNKHILVLADDASAHKPCPGQAKVRCDPTSGGSNRDDVLLHPQAGRAPGLRYRLSIVHFWALIFTYMWAGPHHLHYTALPDWTQSVGMVFSLILLAPAGAA